MKKAALAVTTILLTFSGPTYSANHSCAIVFSDYKNSIAFNTLAGLSFLDTIGAFTEEKNEVKVVPQHA